MGGAQPLAVTMNGGVALCVEVDPTRIAAAPRDALPRRGRRLDLDDAIAPLRGRRKAERRALSVGLCANAADVRAARCSSWASTADIVTDQTSAHDPLSATCPPT